MTAYEFTLAISVSGPVSSTMHGLLFPPTDRHQTQCHRWSELSSALTGNWQLNETHWSQVQCPATWQMKHTAAASRGTGQKIAQTLSEAAEPWRLFSFLQSSLSPLLLSLSSSLLSLCVYVLVYVCLWQCACVWVRVSVCEWAAPSPSASQLLGSGSSQEMNGSAQRTVVLANDLPRVTWSAKCRVGRWVEAS